MNDELKERFDAFIIEAHAIANELSAMDGMIFHDGPIGDRNTSSIELASGGTMVVHLDA